ASWRYVFVAETLIMMFVLLVTNKIADKPITKKQKLDIPSAVLSASGLGILVFGILQSKVWGWVTPKAIPSINGHEIAPFGISIVAYLILAGVVILAIFYSRQNSLKAKKKQPLLDTALLQIKTLRSGLAVLLSQYLIIAAVFFVIPVYLQVNLGYDALKTGLKILPLSIALILFSVIGMRLANKLTARRIVRIGQIGLVIGSLILMGSINVEMKGALFASGMFVLGAGLGLLASQLGNINMSSVDESKTTEVGGLQGTFQNLGSALGTALIGSVFIAALGSGFVTGINHSTVSNQVKDSVNANSSTSLQIVSASQAEDIATSKGLSEQDAADVSKIYNDSQLEALQEAMFFLAVVALFSIILSKNLPNKRFS
ncbi:MAG TPA: MFS transporter, partial [Candidatus Saccharimonadales bacterium]|nr:MFS transporter [Candidatus Saccharimonadales bacterium]